MNELREKGPLAMVKSETFKAQMKALDKEARETILSSLNRLRLRLPTPGVESPWDGDWRLWPCGERKVLYRELAAEEVEAVTGAKGDGVLLDGIEPSPW